MYVIIVAQAVHEPQPCARKSNGATIGGAVDDAHSIA